MTSIMVFGEQQYTIYDNKKLSHRTNEFRKISLENLMPWKGECKRCGACCTFDIKWIGYDGTSRKEEEAIEWLQAKGYKLIQVGRNVIQATYNHLCPNLEKRLCKIQDNKPKWCQRFPDNLQMDEFARNLDLDINKILFENCGFKWVEE